MKLELLRLIGSQTFLHASMSGMRMATPLLALSQGYSAMAVGALLSLFAITQVFLALPAGRYADRRGMRKLMVFSVCAAGLGAALAAIWPTYPVLCLSAMATGGATGMLVIALQRHVGRLVQGTGELRTAFSWLSIGPAFSNFIGPVMAGLMIDYAGSRAADETGFRAAFVLMALLPVVTWLGLRNVREQHCAPSAEARGSRRVLDLLRQPMMMRLLAVNWLLASCWDVHTFVVPVLGHERGLSASVVGTLLGSFALAAAFIRIMLPWVSRHLREHQIIAMAMCSTAVLFCVYPWMSSAWTMGICSVLLGLVLGMVQPMIMSTLHQITPAHRQGEALGLRMLSINASSVLMPMLFGAAGAVAGVAPVFWVVGAAVGSGARMAWGLRATGKAH